MKENIFDKIKSAIVEAAKNNSVLIEPTENGGVIISPMKEEKPKSGIYFDEETNNVYVVFGGRIKVGTKKFPNEKGCSIGLQELDGNYRPGEIQSEPWSNDKASVHLVISDKESIQILRKALDTIEKSMNV